MTPRKLRSLCKLDLPSFDVGWPPEGTLDWPIVHAVPQVVTGTPGHPDQFPCIDYWLLIVQILHGQRFCTNRQGRIEPLWPNHSEKERRKNPIYSRSIQWKTHCCPHHTFPDSQAPAQPAPDPLPDIPPPTPTPGVFHTTS